MTTLNFEKVDDRYEATYSGESGALQMVMPSGTHVYVSGTADGSNYDLLENGVFKGGNMLQYLNMTGLKSVKISCTAEPTSGVVNS